MAIIYVTNKEYRADLKVYEEKHEYRADMSVYLEDQRYLKTKRRLRLVYYKL